MKFLEILKFPLRSRESNSLTFSTFVVASCLARASCSAAEEHSPSSVRSRYSELGSNETHEVIDFGK